MIETKIGDRFHGMDVESVSDDGKSFTAIAKCGNGVLLRYMLNEIADTKKRKHFLVFTGEDRTETQGKFYEADVQICGFWK